jgi:hypothetical protein
MTYGYHLMVNNWFGVEFALSLGFLYLRYDRFEPQWNGRPLGFGEGLYVGPTSGGVNLVFLLK